MPLFKRPSYICQHCRQLIKGSSSTVKSIQHGFKRTIATAGNRPRPFRLAIVGSGPAGFYAASRVMREHNQSIVDMYEHLPTPFGLVRYGVAPDHPEVKNCQDRFEEIASLPNFHFIGNISVGADIPLADLKPHYDAILFAYGASKDRELGIPGEHLNGVYSARSFVAWYNGLPGFSDLQPNLIQGDEAVVIGQGNVALDVARILLTSVDKLRKTDMPEHALDTLSRSRIKKVHIVGRRGPIQAAFTIKEAREITKIPDCTFVPVSRDFFPEDTKTLARPQRRIAELIIKSSMIEKKTSHLEKSCSFDFLLSPSAFLESETSANQLNGVTFRRTQYKDHASRFDPSASVAPLPGVDNVQIPASIAFRSIGYKSEPLLGLGSLGIPFDDRRGIIPNHIGRILQTASDEDVASYVPGMYVAGWAKRGPTGVIASTMEDAFATADCIVQDIPANNALPDGSTGQGWNAIRASAEKRGLRRFSWNDWRAIDGIEKDRGSKLGKEREKITSIAEMLSLVSG